jgi:hypothetical protein
MITNEMHEQRKRAGMLIVAKSVVQNVSDLRHVSGFLLAFRFLYTNNTDLHDKTEILFYTDKTLNGV